MALVMTPQRREDADDHLRFLVASMEERLHPHLRYEHHRLTWTAGILAPEYLLLCTCGWLTRISTLTRRPVTEIREAVFRHAEEANDKYLRWDRDDD